MLRVGTWKVAKGDSIADAIRKACDMCYVPRVINCIERNGEIMPPWMLPAGVPADWRAEVAARVARGGR